MANTLSIGGATYDLFVNTGSDLVHANAFSLPLGEKIRVENVTETCGGGASNTSVGLARLGCNACFCGVLGSDQWGEALLNNMQNEKVDTRWATIVENEISSFSIILSASSGERTILYEPGTNEHLHDANFNRDIAKEMDWVYLNHIQENSCVIQDDIIDVLASDDDIHFTWNPGGCQIDIGINEGHNKKLLEHTDMLLLNKEEALRFTQSDDVKAALRLLSKAGAKVVCITNGSNGTVATDGSQFYECPTMKNIDVVDTTGAGDAFGTGVTWALATDQDLPTALRAGTINATGCVGAIGAQTGLLTDIEMQTQLKQCNLDVNVSAL